MDIILVVVGGGVLLLLHPPAPNTLESSATSQSHRRIVAASSHTSPRSRNHYLLPSPHYLLWAARTTSGDTSPLARRVSRHCSDRSASQQPSLPPLRSRLLVSNRLHTFTRPARGSTYCRYLTTDSLGSPRLCHVRGLLHIKTCRPTSYAQTLSSSTRAPGIEQWLPIVAYSAVPSEHLRRAVSDPPSRRPHRGTTCIR